MLKKHKWKHRCGELQEQVDKLKELCIQLKKENVALKNKVYSLEHPQMNQPKKYHARPFYYRFYYPSNPFGTDSWRYW